MDNIITYQPYRALVTKSAMNPTAKRPAASNTPPAATGVTDGDNHPVVAQRCSRNMDVTADFMNTSNLAPKRGPIGQPIGVNNKQRVHSMGEEDHLSRNHEDDQDEKDLPTLDQLFADIEGRRILARPVQNTNCPGNDCAASRDISSVIDSRQTSGNHQDPIILSDDESEDDISDTADSSLDPGLAAETDSNSLHNFCEGPGGSHDLNSGTTATSNSHAGVPQTDEKNRDDSQDHTIQTQAPACFRRSSVLSGPNDLLSTKIMTDSIGEAPVRPEVDVFDVFAESDDENTDKTPAEKPQREPTILRPRSSPGRKISETQGPQVYYTQGSHPASGVAGVQQQEIRATFPSIYTPQNNSFKDGDFKNSDIEVTAGNESPSAKLQSSDIRKPYLDKPATDPDKLWKFRKILGRKVIRGKVLYCVKWEPTWERESEMTEGMDSLDKFMVKLPGLQNKTNDRLGRQSQMRQPPKPNKLWRFKIIGRRESCGHILYWVDWDPTWEPESALTKEWIDEFVAELRPSCPAGRQDRKQGRPTAENYSQAGPTKRRRLTQKGI